MSDRSLPTESLATHATPLKTTDLDAPLSDLDPLRDRLADATVIGLGEATHGTREFFELKARLIRYLVAELGCRLVALEADFAATLAADAYVARGDGTPEAALERDPFWTWETATVRDLLEWLRAFNAGRPADDRVRVHGLDVQYTAGAVDELREFLCEADPDLLDRIDGDLAAVDDEWEPGYHDDDVPAQTAAAADLVPRLRDRIEANRGAYAVETDERSTALAERLVDVIDRAVERRAAAREWTAAGEPTDGRMARLLAVRDEAMAENAAWLRSFTGTDRAALWAHDAHVNRVGQRRGTDAEAPSLGAHLAARHGDGYLAVGFSFGGGAFQAIAPTDAADDERTLRRVSVARSETGSLDAALGDLGHALAYLDVRGALAAGDDSASDWLRRPQSTFETGATYDPSSPGEALTTYRYGEAFDAVCYVDTTTRARPLESD